MSSQRQHHNPTAHRGGLHLFLWVFAAVFCAVVAAAWVIKAVIFPDRFTLVQLSPAETQSLSRKLAALGLAPQQTSDQSEARSSKAKTKQGLPGAAAQPSNARPAPLEPEAFDETGSSRQVAFNERELNGLLTNNTDLASRLAFDLSDDLASAKLLMVMPADLPIIGGKTLRLHAGLGLTFTEARPSIVLRGVSVAGVPLPNAWLGNLKDVDLVEAFGNEPGFWQTLAAGIEAIEVHEGRLAVRLKP